MEGSSTRQLGHLALFVDGERPRLEQVHHAQPVQQNQGLSSSCWVIIIFEWIFFWRVLTFLREIVVMIKERLQVFHQECATYFVVIVGNKMTWLSFSCFGIAGRERLREVRDGTQTEEEDREDPRGLSSRLEIQGNARAATVRRFVFHRQGQWMRISPTMRIVVLWLQLALRAGNEKDTDEAADTVGCCSLRVEHIKLHDEHDGKE